MLVVLRRFTSLTTKKMTSAQSQLTSKALAYDLRSDTVTKPTAAMRAAMASAEVGDDVWGDDPTVSVLETRAAALFGKEAGLFVPSGTMGNLIAVLTHCRERGSEFIVGDEAHVFVYEQGGAAQLGGVHPRTVPTNADGTLDLAHIAKAIRGDDPHYPVTKLVCIENTHNRKGGRVLTAEYTDAVGALVHQRQLKLHVDGARIMNAVVALDVTPARLVQAADTVSVCLSKALGAPIGSVLVGPKDFIHQARRLRKALGGGMRQVGVIAAPALIALEDMPKVLALDHANAKRLAKGILALPREYGVTVDMAAVETNIVFLQVERTDGVKADAIVARLREDHGVGSSAFSDLTIRFCLHHQVSTEDVDGVIAALNSVLSAFSKQTN